jgi:hypothetical protein
MVLPPYALTDAVGAGFCAHSYSLLKAADTAFATNA